MPSHGGLWRFPLCDGGPTAATTHAAAAFASMVGIGGGGASVGTAAMSIIIRLRCARCGVRCGAGAHGAVRAGACSWPRHSLCARWWCRVFSSCYRRPAAFSFVRDQHVRRLIFNPSIGETGSRKQQSENWSKHGASSQSTPRVSRPTRDTGSHLTWKY